jgi:hypothetical protein
MRSPESRSTGCSPASRSTSPSRDSDAWIHRVSYHITLLGKIVFTPIVIT